MNADQAGDYLELLCRAFSDPKRLRILNLLQAGDLSVHDIVAVLRIPQERALIHLTYLRRAGLIQSYRSPTVRRFVLALAPTPPQQKVLAFLERNLEGVPEIQADRTRLRKLEKQRRRVPGNADAQIRSAVHASRLQLSKRAGAR